MSYCPEYKSQRLQRLEDSVAEYLEEYVDGKYVGGETLIRDLKKILGLEAQELSKRLSMVRYLLDRL